MTISEEILVQRNYELPLVATTLFSRGTFVTLSGTLRKRLGVYTADFRFSLFLNFFLGYEAA